MGKPAAKQAWGPGSETANPMYVQLSVILMLPQQGRRLRQETAWKVTDQVAWHTSVDEWSINTWLLHVLWCGCACTLTHEHRTYITHTQTCVLKRKALYPDFRISSRSPWIESHFWLLGHRVPHGGQEKELSDWPDPGGHGLCHFTLKGTGKVAFFIITKREMLRCYKTKPKQTNEVRVPQTETSTTVFEAFCTASVPTQAFWECSALLMASVPWERRQMVTLDWGHQRWSRWLQQVRMWTVRAWPNCPWSLLTRYPECYWLAHSGYSCPGVKWMTVSGIMPRSSHLLTTRTTA